MNIAVIGQKYEGKSTLALVLACRIRYHAKAFRIPVFDPKWAFRNSTPIIDGHSIRLAHTEDIAEFSELMFNDYPEEDSPDVVCFRPGLDFDDNESIAREFTSFCESIELENLLRNPPERPIVILVDEASYLQDGRYTHPWLANTNRLAVKDKLYMLQAVHAPKEISPKIRREMDEFYFFRQNEPVDLDAITERCGVECAEIVSRLPLHHVLKFDAKTRTYELLDHPEKWFTEISKESNENGKHESASS